MTRIAASMQRDGRPLDDRLMRRLWSPFDDEGTSPAIDSFGTAAVSSRPLRGMPWDNSLARSGPVGIAFDGRLDNREELLAQLDDAMLTSDACDSSIVVACYRRFGPSFAGRLNGDFALAIFDSEHQRMLLARDAVGVRPLYYYTGLRDFVTASEIKIIVAHPCVRAEPDDSALADLLVGGNPDERRLTLFRNVRRLLPGHTLLVSRDRTEEFRHWDFDTTRQVRYAAIDDYACALRERFERSVRRRLRGESRVAVAVSGGLDSSAILCQAQLTPRSPTLRVLGISNLYPEGSAADERTFLDDIESHCGAEILRLPASPIRTAMEATWTWRQEQPWLPGDPQLELLEAAKKAGCKTVLHGYFGDQALWSYAHLFDPIRRFRWLLAARRFHNYARSQADCSPQVLLHELLHAFARDIAPDGALQLLRWLRRHLAGARAAPWFAPSFVELGYRRSQEQRRDTAVRAPKHAQLCRRLVNAPHVVTLYETFCKTARHHGIEQAYPFADRDLLEFIMAVPGEVLAHEGLYKGLFRVAMRGVLPDSIRHRYWKADFTGLEAAAAGTLAGTLGMLRDGLAGRFGYLDPAKVDRALHDARSRLSAEDYRPSLQLNQLCALEFWLREFFADSGAARDPAAQHDPHVFSSKGATDEPRKSQAAATV